MIEASPWISGALLIISIAKSGHPARKRDLAGHMQGVDVSRVGLENTPAEREGFGDAAAAATLQRRREGRREP